MKKGPTKYQEETEVGRMKDELFKIVRKEKYQFNRWILQGKINKYGEINFRKNNDKIIRVKEKCKISDWNKT